MVWKLDNICVLWLNMYSFGMVHLIMWSDNLKTRQKIVRKVICSDFRCWVFRWLLYQKVVQYSGSWLKNRPEWNCTNNSRPFRTSTCLHLHCSSLHVLVTSCKSLIYRGKMSTKKGKSNLLVFDCSLACKLQLGLDFRTMEYQTHWNIKSFEVRYFQWSRPALWIFTLQNDAQKELLFKSHLKMLKSLIFLMVQTIWKPNFS